MYVYVYTFPQHNEVMRLSHEQHAFSTKTPSSHRACPSLVHQVPNHTAQKSLYLGAFDTHSFSSPFTSA